MRNGLLLFILLGCYLNVAAQSVLRLQVRDAKTFEVLPDVAVGVKDSYAGGVTDTAGKLSLTIPAPGRVQVSFAVIGYEHKTIIVQLPDTSLISVFLNQDENNLKEVIVASTRNDKRLEDAPMKIEVVDKEEMQEEQAARPANVVGMLGDIGGIRVQQTSVVNGNANVRIQGLDGRYTQMLRDGMPLYDGLSGGFGILQVQPLDLKQIELIKGAASTLYGGGAIGGLINFISKTPSTDQAAEVILNQTSLGETNATAFLSKKYRRWGYTLFGGYTWQKAADINKDGLSDVPKVQTLNLHPRLFFYPDDKTIITLGYSATSDHRKGGDMTVLAGQADALHRYYETNNSVRSTGELMAERKINSALKATFKSSISGFDEVIRTNTHYFSGSQLNYFSEATVLVTRQKYNCVVGADVQGTGFRKNQSDPTPLEDFSSTTIGGFGQLTLQLPLKTLLQAGVRIDDHSRYGNFVLPSVAIIHHINGSFTARAGFGAGYKTPNALDQQMVEYNIEQLQQVGDSVKPERSYGFNAELVYKKQWEREKKLYISSSPFLTQVDAPIVATEVKNDNVIFTNAARPVITRGVDNYAKLQLGELEVYLGYTYTFARRTYLAVNQLMPLTPLHHLAFTTTYEVEGKWRFGAEFDYTGMQYRDNDSRTPAWTTFAALIEKDFGRRLAIMLNAENLFDTRQSRYETLYKGTLSSPKFKPVWAPLDGRVVNVALRLRL